MLYGSFDSVYKDPQGATGTDSPKGEVKMKGEFLNPAGLYKHYQTKIGKIPLANTGAQRPLNLTINLLECPETRCLAFLNIEP